MSSNRQFGPNLGLRYQSEAYHGVEIDLGSTAAVVCADWLTIDAKLGPRKRPTYRVLFGYYWQHYPAGCVTIGVGRKRQLFWGQHMNTVVHGSTTARRLTTTDALIECFASTRRSDGRTLDRIVHFAPRSEFVVHVMERYRHARRVEKKFRMIFKRERLAPKFLELEGNTCIIQSPAKS